MCEETIVVLRRRRAPGEGEAGGGDQESCDVHRGTGRCYMLRSAYVHEVKLLFCTVYKNTLNLHELQSGWNPFM